MSKFEADSFPVDTPSTYPTVEMKDLFEAILSLKNLSEAKEFFRDLLTMPELKEFANRWQIVQMLADGKTYLEIAEKVSTSTTTVSRCAYWLNHGLGGYDLVITRRKVSELNRKKSKYSKSKTDRFLKKISSLNK
ncbi:YerC/YecD family TrpR-related protein [Patescibacteria group bacterium]